MHENLIYEGNTIYELDPECLRGKEKREKEKREKEKSSRLAAGKAGQHSDKKRKTRNMGR